MVAARSDGDPGERLGRVADSSGRRRAGSSSSSVRARRCRRSSGIRCAGSMRVSRATAADRWIWTRSTRSTRTARSRTARTHPQRRGSSCSVRWRVLRHLWLVAVSSCGAQSTPNPIANNAGPERLPAVQSVCPPTPLPAGLEVTPWTHELFAGCPTAQFPYDVAVCNGECPRPCRAIVHNGSTTQTATFAYDARGRWLSTTSDDGPSLMYRGACTYDGDALATCNRVTMRRDERRRLVRVSAAMRPRRRAARSSTAVRASRRVDGRERAVEVSSVRAASSASSAPAMRARCGLRWEHAGGAPA